MTKKRYAFQHKNSFSNKKNLQNPNSSQFLPKSYPTFESEINQNPKHILMKAFILASFLSASSLFTFAQDIKETEVPSVVMNSFKGQYADALKTEWEKKGNNYEAEFEVGTVERSVILDPSGKVLMQKQEIANTELPAAVANAVKQNYKSYDLEEAEKIEYNGQTYYKVELERFFLDKDVIFTAEGKETTLPF